MTTLIWGSVLMRLDFHYSICKWRLLYLSSSSQRNQEKKAIYTVLIAPGSLFWQHQSPYHCDSPERTPCSGQSWLNVRAGLGLLSCEPLTLLVTTCRHSTLPPKPPWCHFSSGAFPDPPHLFLPFFSHITMQHLINSALYYNQLCACFSEIVILGGKTPLSVSFASSSMEGGDLPKELINQHGLHRLRGRRRPSLPTSLLS